MENHVTIVYLPTKPHIIITPYFIGTYTTFVKSCRLNCTIRLANFTVNKIFSYYDSISFFIGQISWFGKFQNQNESSYFQWFVKALI
jgi:hypothetical protein